jgi:RNA polymerase sigma-70 factor (ECF subfamily)
VLNRGPIVEPWPDEVLIRRFLTGDEAAFRRLYARHAPRLRMTILRILGHRDQEADDVLQDAWVSACRALHQFRGDARFSTWLAAIAIRAARRRMDWTAAHVELYELHEELTAPAGSPGQNVDLERALSRLGDAHRAIVVLHDVEGYTHEEIASLLGIAAGTSRSLLTRGRRSLRRLLTSEPSHA